MLTFFGMEKKIGIDTTDFTCDLYREFRRIKGRYAADTAARVPESIPQFTAAVAKRCQASKPADDNAIGTWISALEERHAKIIHATLKSCTLPADTESEENPYGHSSRQQHDAHHQREPARRKAAAKAAPAAEETKRRCSFSLQSQRANHRKLYPENRHRWIKVFGHGFRRLCRLNLRNPRNPRRTIFPTRLTFVVPYSYCKFFWRNQMGANTVEITDTNFESEVEKSSTPVLVDFWAAWCAPCRALAPTVDAIADEYKGRVKVGKLDVDSNGSTASRFNIRGIPTLLVIKDGQVKEQIVGAVDKSVITKALDKHL
jgi:thioredoxin 1